MRKMSQIIAGVGCVAALGVIAADVWQDAAPRPQVVSTAPSPLQEVPLIGGNGAAATLKSLGNTWAVVLFGYLSCPDVCPTSLAFLGKELKALSDVPVKGVFISVDPQRDTPAAISTYVHYFDDRMVGFTGTEDNLRTLTKQVGAYFEYQGQGTPNYQVAHSPAFFVLNPAGQLVATLSPPHEPGAVVKTLRQLLAGHS